ncbi:MAG: hypothetical protein M3552_19485 [Planctomycetota bacterium]|nr:hypothetical protein [Planctomycetaceae bacterium]MDQ3332800.1 hypothetical protein [Planctomycetota bacterium]
MIDLSPDEQRRLRLCRVFALLAPIITASLSFGILRTAWLIGGPRMMTTPAGRSFWRIYEMGVMPGNVLLGSLAAFAAVLVLHPIPGRRRQVAVACLVLSPVVHIACYLVWERFWHTVV